VVVVTPLDWQAPRLPRPVPEFPTPYVEGRPWPELADEHGYPVTPPMGGEPTDANLVRFLASLKGQPPKRSTWESP
jgi:hypothetical protein